MKATPHIEPHDIQRRVAQARKKAGFSQEQMADLLTVHVNTVRNYEGSGPDPTVPLDRLDLIAGVTNTSVPWLLWGTEAVTAGDATRLLEDVRDRLAQVAGALAQLVGTLGEAQPAPPKTQRGRSGSRRATGPQSRAGQQRLA